MSRSTRLLTFLALFASSIPAIAATSYAPGFVWNRYQDWTSGSAVGTTQGNPASDKNGSPVWGYSYTSGGALDSTNPWYRQERSQMTWDHWDPAGAPVRDVWSRTDNSEPLVSKYGLSYSRSSKWNSWEYQSVVEWNNPTDSVAIVDISGYFKLTWAGVGGAPDVDLDAVITKYNSITDTYTELVLSRYSNPAPGSSSPVDLTVPISFLNQRFGEGDSLLLSLRAVSAPSQLDSWNLLSDGGMKITLVSLVPEPETYAMLLSGLGLLALGARRRRQSPTV